MIKILNSANLLLLGLRRSTCDFLMDGFCHRREIGWSVDDIIKTALLRSNTDLLAIFLDQSSKGIAVKTEMHFWSGCFLRARSSRCFSWRSRMQSLVWRYEPISKSEKTSVVVDAGRRTTGTWPTAKETEGGRLQDDDGDEEVKDPELFHWFMSHKHHYESQNIEKLHDNSPPQAKFFAISFVGAISFCARARACMQPSMQREQKD